MPPKQTRHPRARSRITTVRAPLAGLLLHPPAGPPLNLPEAELAITSRGATVAGCSLILRASLAQYRRIDQENLFNLQPPVRGAFAGETFDAAQPITITANLHPDLLPRIAPFLRAPDSAAAYLQGLARAAGPDALLLTESWFAMAVEQRTGKDRRGYHTFWSHLSISDTTRARLESGEMLDSLLTFAEERPELADLASSPAMTQDIGQLAAEEAANLASPDLAELLARLEEIAELSEDEIAALAAELGAEDEEEQSLASLGERVAAFFESEGWEFQASDDQATLWLMFEGEAGQWSCAAHTSEDMQQVVFYSICPATVPAQRIPAMAELITRINYDLIIGNFECSWDDGTLRYKTSIDVEGDTLSAALCSQLVYANVLTMDHYMPALQAVMADTEPLAALRLVDHG